MDDKIMIDESSIQLLQKIYLGCKGNIYALNYAIKQTVNTNFKNQLQKNCNENLKIINCCLGSASKLKISLMDINFIKKTKIKSILKFNSFVDDSTQNSAKQILTLLSAEIFNTIKAIDCTPNCIEEVKNIAISYNKVLEKCVAETKKFLLNDPSKFEDMMQKKKESKVTKKKKKTVKQTKNNHE